MKNEYVTNHDYGYGANKKKVNKLVLRNINDAQTYVEEIIHTQLDAAIKKNIIIFFSDGHKEQFQITML